MLKKIIISFCIFTAVYIQAEIIEINHIDDVRPYITKQDTLYLFDIDDTLINNPFSLGNPSWRSWVKSKIPKYDTKFVMFDALTLYIARNAHYKTVETTTAKLISDLQSSGAPVFGFTARGRSQWYSTNIEGIDRFTHQQLNHVGIDFKQTRIPTELQNLEPAYFLDGIIFANHIQKGDLLKQLIKDLNYHPSLIIFIDDKLDQVQSVEAAVKEAGIPFIGFWYRRFEIDGASFNPIVANIQLESLLLKNEIISDEDAEKIAETKQQIDPQVYFKEILDKIDKTQLDPRVPVVNEK